MNDVFAMVNADFVSHDDTLTAIPGFELEVESGHTYQVYGQVAMDNGFGGFKLDFGGGDATAVGVVGAITGYNAANAQPLGQVIDSLTFLTDAQLDGTLGLLFNFTVEIDEGGTIAFRFAQRNVVDKTPSTVKKYTTMTAIDITP